MKKRKGKNNHNIIHYLLIIIEYIFREVIQALLWLILGIAGLFIYQTKYSPYHLIIGLPVFLIGVGLAINNIITFLFGVFIFRYNRGVCRWCEGRK